MKGELKSFLTLCAVAAAAVAGPAAAQTPPPQPAAPQAPQTAKASDPVGRLFFTPPQRESLDLARTRRVRTTLTNEGEDSTPQTQNITYGGIVRRSDGRSTVWINGRPVNDSDASVVGRIRPDGSISLQMPQSGRSVSLKPGQSIELLTGEIEEGFTRKPAAPASKPAAQSAAEGKPAAKPAPQGRAVDERDREEQQRKIEETLRALQDAAAKSGAAPVTPPQQPSR